MTDGNITKDYKGFEIQLTEEDGYILEKIGDLIGASKTHPVQRISCEAKRRQKGFSRSRDMVRLSVYSRKIADDLRKLGVVKNKTKIMRYRGGVPDKFLSSFFRGLIDGDGTFCLGKNGWLHCNLVSASKRFIDDLHEVVTRVGFKCSVGHSSTKYKGGKSTIFVLRASTSKKEVIRFIRWLYNSNSDFYLRRKREKVQDQIC